MTQVVAEQTTVFVLTNRDKTGQEKKEQQQQLNRQRSTDYSQQTRWSSRLGLRTRIIIGIQTDEKQQKVIGLWS